MVYSDVVSNGLILPRKEKYTMRDVNKLITDSLFNPVYGRTLTKQEAVFIIKCSAIHYNTDYSESIRRYAHNEGVYTGLVV